MTKSGSERLAAWLPYLFLLALCGALFHELIFQGKAYIGDSDRLFSHLPLLQFASRCLIHHRLPLWISLNLCGYPLAASGANLLNPVLMPLLVLFPKHVVLADSLRLFVEVLFMFWIGYLLFLKVWRDRILAVFSSVMCTMCVSSVVLYKMPFSIPYGYLLMLYILWDWPGRRFLLNVVGLAAVLSLHLLGIMPQHGGYFLFFAFAVSFCRTAFGAGADRRRTARFLLLWAVSGGLALMISAPFLVPFLQGMRSSNRVSMSYPAAEAILRQPWFSMLRLALPYFMGDFYQFPESRAIPAPTILSFFRPMPAFGRCFSA